MCGAAGHGISTGNSLPGADQTGTAAGHSSVPEVERLLNRPPKNILLTAPCAPLRIRYSHEARKPQNANKSQENPCITMSGMLPSCQGTGWRILSGPYGPGLGESGTTDSTLMPRRLLTQQGPGGACCGWHSLWHLLAASRLKSPPCTPSTGSTGVCAQLPTEDIGVEERCLPWLPAPLCQKREAGAAHGAQHAEDSAAPGPCLHPLGGQVHGRCWHHYCLVIHVRTSP